MIKKIFNCFIVFFILICFTLTVLAKDLKQIDLQTAINMVLKQNCDLKIENLKINKAQLEYQKRKAENLMGQSGYRELEAEYSLAVAEKSYQNIHDNLIIITIKQFSELWLLQLELEIKEKRVELSKLFLEEAKAQLEMGDIRSIDYLEKENSLDETIFNLEKAHDEYQQNLKEFKTLLGLEEIYLPAGLNRPEIWQIKEKKAIEIALKNSSKFKLKEKEIKLKELDLNRAKISAADLDRRIKELSLEISKKEISKIKEEIIESTRQAYYQFRQAVKNLLIKKKRQEEATKKYLLRKEQYEAGLIKLTELLQFEINMMEKELSYRSAIADYYLKEQSLKQLINLETGVLIYDQINKK